MDNSHDLELIIKARTPLVVIESHEEQRVLGLFKPLALRLATPLFRWTITEGLKRLDLNLTPQKHNTEPGRVLAHIKSSRLAGIYVLIDFHPYLDDPVHVRLLKDIAVAHDTSPCTVVLLSHSLELPAELKRYSARFELALPDKHTLKNAINKVADTWQRENGGGRVKADPAAVDLLVRNLAGLTLADASRLARNAIYNDGAITHSDLPQVMKAKHRLLDKEGVFSFEYDTARFSDVGGLTRLKHWLQQRGAAFHQQTPIPGLDPPKGVLLLGVQGCGKSLAAKAIAGIYGVPLLRLDFGALYNKYYGETERRLRESLRTAEIMAPCVLWMDEIEKGLTPQDIDSGPARRVLATLLTWMAEKRAPVFLAATANDIAVLPPELIRKGRFDEIFFVDLPKTEVRADILAIHLQKRGLNPDSFDLETLASASDGFTGAELEQAVVSAVYACHAQKQQVLSGHVLDEIEQTRPLSITMAEQVNALRAWAADRTVPAD